MRDKKKECRAFGPEATRKAEPGAEGSHGTAPVRACQRAAGLAAFITESVSMVERELFCHAPAMARRGKMPRKVQILSIVSA